MDKAGLLAGAGKVLKTLERLLRPTNHHCHFYTGTRAIEDVPRIVNHCILYIEHDEHKCVHKINRAFQIHNCHKASCLQKQRISSISIILVSMS